MLISESLAQFARNLRYEEIPDAILRRARLILLDAIGIALASSRFDFASKAYSGLSCFGPGPVPVIGFERSLPLRDAVILNGILVHGLDYDDTYLPGSVHMSSSNVPCALGMAVHTHASGRDFLSAYIAGLETAARIGRAGRGGFHKAGFHPTSICGTMACALSAGRFMDLDETALVRAQGIALSMASGSMQTIQDGTWTKRMHPGWAAAAGITAAGLAQGGFTGPKAAYEGHFGLYRLFLGPFATDADLSLVTEDLGQDWQFARATFKLYPACHQSHAFMNAAIKLARENEFAPEDVASVTTLVSEMTRDLVCEPQEVRKHPDSSYLTQFSLPYAMAATLTRKEFTLREIEDSAFTDPKLIALAQKVSYEIDPAAGFPKTRTGEVVVKLKNGKVIRERNEIKPDDPPRDEEIVAKFLINAASTCDASEAQCLSERILSIDADTDMVEFANMLKKGALAAAREVLAG